MTDWKQTIEAQIAELQHEGWYATQDTEAGAVAATLQALLDEIERNRKEIDGLHHLLYRGDLIKLLRQERVKTERLRSACRIKKPNGSDSGTTRAISAAHGPGVCLPALMTPPKANCQSPRFFPHACLLQPLPA